MLGVGRLGLRLGFVSRLALKVRDEYRVRVRDEVGLGFMFGLYVCLFGWRGHARRDKIRRDKIR